jgi:predicted O-methyltransferase YrrM
MKCPNCQSTKLRKHGFYRGKQRYQCKECVHQFIENQHPYLQQQISVGVEERIENYIRSISTPSATLLLALQRDLAECPLAQMQPSLSQAQLIAQLMRSMGASRVLEVGIFSGYTTLAIALALTPPGQIISCGVAGPHLEISRAYWDRAGVATKIDFQIGSGLELLDRLLAVRPLETFDSILISGLKHQYPLYYQRAIELLSPKGLLIATDVLWQGRVLNPDAYDDEFTHGIDRFNRELVADKRLEVTVLPIGDGLSIAFKL